MAKKQKKVKKKTSKKVLKKKMRECSCSLTETKSVEDQIRDIINFINVKKEEEVEGATHCIELDTAEELRGMLEELAGKVAGICR